MADVYIIPKQCVLIAPRRRGLFKIIACFTITDHRQIHLDFRLNCLLQLGINYKRRIC
jgi:hypothetical protein